MDDLDSKGICYICLEDDPTEPTPLSKCACTAVVHSHCLERYLNSAKLRGKPLEARMVCSICAGQYACPLSFYLIGTRPPGWCASRCSVPAATFARLRRDVFMCRVLDSIMRPLAALSIFGMIGLLLWVVGQYRGSLSYGWIAIGGFLVALPLFAYARMRQLRRRNAEAQDDNVWYRKVVAGEAVRAIDRGLGVSFAEANAVSPQRVVVLLPAVLQSESDGGGRPREWRLTRQTAASAMLSAADPQPV
ncbi:hypothetical protein T492DRAFT_1009870 [Pavlovales sp. CCMP2436]|nr:hypothetical protein T492DRAFT_1009870 [Pavlovales sp. CCMP2436]